MSKEERLEINFLDPVSYTKEIPLHIAIFGYNGSGKTTLAGTTGLRTVILDCGDSGAITLRKHPDSLKTVRVVRIRNINHYLDVVGACIQLAQEDKIDLLVPDTFTGLQTMAIKEVKPKRTFDMNQRKWGMVSSRMIECLAETRNFPRDVIYLVQEKTKSGGDDGVDKTQPALTPSVKGQLSSMVDWVGWLTVRDDEKAPNGVKRVLDFRISETLEVKDRAEIFPKLIAKPNYIGLRKKILSIGETNVTERD